MSIIAKLHDPNYKLDDDEIIQLCQETNGLVDLTYDGMTITELYSHQLNTLPANLTIIGDFHANYCNDLYLNHNLTIRGSCHMNYCLDLKTLPPNMNVNTLYINCCENLENLNNIKVETEASVQNCFRLSQLPTKFYISYELDLTNCINLHSLGNDLYVGGDLKLINCPQLKTLPKQLQVIGNVIIDKFHPLINQLNQSKKQNHINNIIIN